MADPLPKPSAQRRRRNKTAGPVRLGTGVRRSAPALRGAASLLPQTVEWWERVWASPMAAVWLEADVPALERLAYLMDLSFQGEATAALLSEIRQLEDRFGLSPLARRRLQWELEQATGETGAQAEDPGEDDERWLRVV